MKHTCHAIALCKISGDTAADRWYHSLPPIGEYPTPIHLPSVTVKGTLIIDATAFASCLEAFRQAAADPAFPGLLVDREHTSEQPDGDTAAVAWAKDMQQRDDGLWTRWELTSTGEPLITGRVYAYRSPAMGLEPIDDVARDQLTASKAKRLKDAQCARLTGKWRPVVINSIALTNHPHFKDLSPALGRAENTETPTMDMQTICQKLGLDPATAKEADVIAAIDALLAAKAEAATAKTECTAAQAELATVRAKQLDADCAAFVLAHKVRIKDVAAVSAQFKAHPEATQALFGALTDQAPAASARVLARSQGNPGDRDADEDKGAMRSAAIARVAARDSIPRREAVAIARREQPDLWKD